MNIAIIGGGISGLYCANLLDNLGHKITVYEKNKFGGCIDYIEYNSKYYPLSALYIIGNNKFLLDFIEKKHLNVITCDYYLKGYDLFRINIIIIIMLFIILFRIINSKIKKIFIILIILLLLFPTNSKIKNTNIIYKNLLLKLVYPLSLSWGGIDSTKKFLNQLANTNYLTIFILILFMFNYNILKILGNKSYHYFIEDFLKNKNINYQIKNIDSIIIKNNKFIISNIIYDKIIIACNPLYVPIKLSNHDKQYIYNINHGFDFYTTFIHIKENKLICSKNITGFIQFEKDIYLCSSNIQLTKNDFSNNIIFFRSNKYKMGLNYDLAVKEYIENNINGKNNIHYIGRHLAEMDGIYSCLDYVEDHLSKYFNYNKQKYNNIEFIIKYIYLRSFN